jgi:hypothetical protein
VAGIVPITPKESKFSRANAVAPFIEAGNVHVLSSQWGDEFIEECAGFPNAAHDDRVDAASQALARLFITGQSSGVVFLDAWKRHAQNTAVEVPSVARNWRATVTELRARGKTGGSV